MKTEILHKDDTVNFSSVEAGMSFRFRGSYYEKIRFMKDMSRAVCFDSGYASLFLPDDQVIIVPLKVVRDD